MSKKASTKWSIPLFHKYFYNMFYFHSFKILNSKYEYVRVIQFSLMEFYCTIKNSVGLS